MIQLLDPELGGGLAGNFIRVAGTTPVLDGSPAPVIGVY
jgi:hypothetical protein